MASQSQSQFQRSQRQTPEQFDSSRLSVSVFWHHFTGADNFEAKAVVISTKNAIGPIDILPGHANLVSVIQDSISVRTVGGKTHTYLFMRGIVEVHMNSVKFFLEGKKEGSASQPKSPVPDLSTP